MQPRTASPELVTGIIAGTVTLAASPDATPPEWLKLTPRGSAKTRDGRSFTFDPATIAARFAADGIDIPLDTDHSTVLLGLQGKSPNTLGYIDQVEAREDGTHGHVAWNAAGHAVLKARTHRFVSPTIHHDEAGRVTWLHSAALVSAPALTMPAVLAAALHASQGSPMKEIAKALGLPETATEAECLAALQSRLETKPIAEALGLPVTADGPAVLAAIGTLKSGSSNLVVELQTNLAATKQRLDAVEKSARDKEVTAVIDEALKAKKIVPAQRDSYVLMCATDEGLANVKKLLAATPEGLQASALGGLTPPTGDGAIDPVKLAAEARKLVSESGGALSIADAVSQLMAKKG